MSEPMSNHEIEDVLSSIRRLVSEDLRPASRPEPAPAASAPERTAKANEAPSRDATRAADPRVPASAVEEEPQPQADKLLLTPALRVVSETPDWTRRPTSTADKRPAAGNEPPNGSVSEESSDTMLEAPAAQDEEPEEDLNQPFMAEPEEMQSIVSRLGIAVGEDDEEWESPVGDPPAWEEEALAQSADPSDTAPNPASGRLHFRPTTEDIDKPGATASAARAAVEDYVSPDDGPTFLHSEADQQAAATEIPEDVAEIEDIIDEVKPEPRRMVSPPEGDWADAAEAEVRAELEREVEDTAESMFAGAEVAFDEEVLRDLVRDIIREELAGTLGERITRNVRKLVRAEIARALAVREFE